MTNHTTSRRASRAMVAVATLISAGAFAGTASAATYYVRADGGDASQCTGKADAAYSGSGTGQACAWKHPFVALPPGGTPRIAGGDTLLVADGSYQMGIGAPGADSCNESWSYDCFMPKIPSGTASALTRILGKGHDAGCKAPPELWGTGRAWTIFDLRGSNNVEIGCFEVTDHDACIQDHGGDAACSDNGQWAARGIVAEDSSNVKLTDVNIHGMANKGIHAGRLRDWTMTRVTIRANGWVGWDGDVGAHNSANSGNIIFRESEIAWNGCAEKYPGTDIHACWGQQLGGYGDGLGTHETGGNWLLEDTLIHHNTSDGLDLLYMADGGSVTVRRVWAEGNAGNQIKTNGQARIENTVVVGNCGYFDGRFPTMVDGDHCRAQGNALSIGLFANDTVDIVNNTISGEGDCLVLSGGDGGSKLNIANNVMIGEPDRTGDGERSCLHYSDGGAEAVTFTKNHVSGVKNDSCPSGSLCGSASKLASASYDAFDPTPLADSPLLNAAAANVAPSTDYHNRARSTPDIGAVEFGASGGSPTPEPTPDPAPTPDPEPAPEPTPEPDLPSVASIGEVDVWTWLKGNYRVYEAHVVIIDEFGNPVRNATVSGNWSGAGVANGTAVTNADGEAVISGGKKRARRAGVGTFCVTSVTADGMTFDGTKVCDKA